MKQNTAKIDREKAAALEARRVRRFDAKRKSALEALNRGIRGRSRVRLDPEEAYALMTSLRITSERAVTLSEDGEAAIKKAAGCVGGLRDNVTRWIEDKATRPTPVAALKNVRENLGLALTILTGRIEGEESGKTRDA